MRAAANVCRSGDVSTLRDLSVGRPTSTAARSTIRSTSTSASSAFWCNWKNTRAAENIFSDYAYFSSYSDSWLKHCENYCDKMMKRFGLNEQSFVVEVASNDGYLLQYFVAATSAVLGIEPAANVAKVAVEKGVPTLVRFFGTQLAKELAAEGRCADLGSRQQRAGTGPGPERFRRRAQDSAEARGSPDAGVSPPAATDRTQRVRHDLPRTLLVFFDAHDGAHPGGAWVESVRRGRTDDARGLAPRLRLPGGGSNA